jgi:hypothetical protein
MISTARWFGGKCWRAATEGELDALALLVAALGRGERALEREHLVGVGLEPDQLHHWFAGALVGGGRRTLLDR